MWKPYITWWTSQLKKVQLMFDVWYDFILLPEGELAPDIGPGKRPLGPPKFMATLDYHTWWWSMVWTKVRLTADMVDMNEIMRRACRFAFALFTNLNENISKSKWQVRSVVLIIMLMRCPVKSLYDKSLTGVNKN